eukprot:3270603-Pyramimonas_sp.AAC.1
MLAGPGLEWASDPAPAFSPQDKRDEKGNIVRSTRAGLVNSQDKMATRNLKRAIIEERKLYIN